MSMKKNILAALMLVITLGLSACGNSNVTNAGGTGDVGFDPMKNSNLRTIHYDALRQRLLVTFNLSGGSAPMNFLTNNRTVFENSAGTYNATYATYYIRLMGMACEELADDNVFFADGTKIDNVWKKITGAKADESAKAIETALLEKTSGMADDYKNFALCLGAATSAKATFSNFVATSN